jgi:hypothetical protein
MATTSQQKLKMMQKMLTILINKFSRESKNEENLHFSVILILVSKYRKVATKSCFIQSKYFEFYSLTSQSVIRGKV